MLLLLETSDIVTGGVVDYESRIYNITFKAGITRVAFSVPVNDDNVLEGNENFILIIDQSSLPKNVTVGETNKIATVTIMDNDGE